MRSSSKATGAKETQLLHLPEQETTPQRGAGAEQGQERGKKQRPPFLPPLPPYLPQEHDCNRHAALNERRQQEGEAPRGELRHADRTRDELKGERHHELDEAAAKIAPTSGHRIGGTDDLKPTTEELDGEKLNAKRSRPALAIEHSY